MITIANRFMTEKGNWETGSAGNATSVTANAKRKLPGANTQKPRCIAQA